MAADTHQLQELCLCVCVCLFAEHKSRTDETPTADGEAYLTTIRKVENKT